MRATPQPRDDGAVIVGAFVFGLIGRGLREVIVNAPPTLGLVLGDLTHLSFVDHSRHSDESFRRYRMRKLRLSDEQLDGMWNRSVAARFGESFAVAEEDAALAKSYHVEPLADPCLVLNTDPPIGENYIISFPVLCFADPCGQALILRALAEAFDESAVRVAWAREGGTPLALRRVMEARARGLQCTLERVESRGKPAGSNRPMNLPLGWILITDAVEKYPPPRTTLDRILKGHDDIRRIYEPSNRVIVNEVGLVRLLQDLGKLEK